MKEELTLSILCDICIRGYPQAECDNWKVEGS
jgi:hypothetical protein